MLELISKNKATWAVAIIWLFHVSAIAGIALGHFHWFVEKTPLNLMVFLILFFWVYPLNTSRKILAFIVFFSGGLIAEWLGVSYGLLFGDYAYGNNLGPKLGGVPYLIGALWALLTFVCAAITDYLNVSTPFKVLYAALLMVGLDFFMEQSAHQLDFWTFAGNLAAFPNYITWFALALIFQIVLRTLHIKGNRFFS
ncbi:MAG: carotenoid biosynthesis protein, partial [Bacteroidota bacterium]